MKDGLLLYNQRLVVLDAVDQDRIPLRTSLIKEVHKQLSTTYLGERKTLALIKARFY